MEHLWKSMLIRNQVRIQFRIFIYETHSVQTETPVVESPALVTALKAFTTLTREQKAALSKAAPGATMSGKAMADIGSAILRQVQPCADRQVNPGPGAERIRVAINLKLNRDGSLAAPPRVVNHDGIDAENRRYLDRVDDLAIATFTGCSPLRGLPADLYDVPNGWRSFTLRYKLPG